MKLSSGLRAVALFEALKGALVLLAGFGALSLAHHDVQQLARGFIAHLHLNPARGYPHIFIEAADHLANTRLQLLAAGAGLYAAVRFTEAYGLWRERSWAEWLAAVSGAIYVPFELMALSKGITVLRLTTFIANLLVVILMVYALRVRRRSASLA